MLDVLFLGIGVATLICFLWYWIFIIRYDWEEDER